MVNTHRGVATHASQEVREWAVVSLPSSYISFHDGEGHAMRLRRIDGRCLYARPSSPIPSSDEARSCRSGQVTKVRDAARPTCTWDGQLGMIALCLFGKSARDGKRWCRLLVGQLGEGRGNSLSTERSGEIGKEREAI